MSMRCLRGARILRMQALQVSETSMDVGKTTGAWTCCERENWVISVANAIGGELTLMSFDGSRSSKGNRPRTIAYNTQPIAQTWKRNFTFTSITQLGGTTHVGLEGIVGNAFENLGTGVSVGAAVSL